ncbi:hypothetical protein SISSUDRAFT_1066610 [Sistotremastrum suecicum HHB10207 ss-3]|uniref:Uncharacterized protein n=1 Tax=Sistotremastrum suecicum HHB10207 ss-3 TaxID=1314776 RepID=A0A165Y3T8_9AGAM|nr:hypothetical protein SISSUDRAFT_1066610 [Sistotremastrum suecicum HHB10207 ss-3]
MTIVIQIRFRCVWGAFDLYIRAIAVDFIFDNSVSLDVVWIFEGFVVFLPQPWQGITPPITPRLRPMADDSLMDIDDIEGMMGGDDESAGSD